MANAFAIHNCIYARKNYLQIDDNFYYNWQTDVFIWWCPTE